MHRLSGALLVSSILCCCPAAGEPEVQSPHSILNEPLKTQIIAGLQELGERLSAVVKGTAAAGYIDHNVAKHPALSISAEGRIGNDGVVFDFIVGEGNAANWRLWPRSRR